MSILIPLLFLPAFGFFALAFVDAMRATQHVRHDQRWETRVNPAIWLAEYRTKATFDEAGQRLVGRARRYRRWFLIYCLFLLAALLGIAAFGP